MADEANATDHYWRVNAHFSASKFFAGTNTASYVGMREVVDAPIPASDVAVDEVEVIGPATRSEYDEWQCHRVRQEPPPGGESVQPRHMDRQPKEYPLDPDADEEDGLIWVAKGSMEVIVESAEEDDICPEDVDLPTILLPEDFGNEEAEVAEWA